MPSGIEVSVVAVSILGVAACWYDLRTRRVPNAITFGGAALAMIHSVVTHGAGGLLVSMGGWLTGAAIFMPLFALRGMGAGDVKLVACFGAWLGPIAALWIALYAAVAGGIMAVAVALATGYLRTAIANVLLLVTHWRVVGVRPLPELTLEGSRGPRLPYALPIVVGAFATMWFR
jgi:prepilin peptidase CpaA